MTSGFRTIKISDPRFERDGLRHVTVKSRALGQRADLVMFLPDGIALDVALPAVMLLHGVYGSAWSWALNAGAHLTAVRMIASAEIPPLALVMPSDGLWGDGSGYLPHRAKNFEEWIVDEAPRAAREASEGAIREDSKFFIGGLSMGGFGAMRLGTKHADKFAAISAHSSITELEQLGKFVEEPLTCYRAVESDATVLGELVEHRENLLPLRFDCGVDDPLIRANRRLHEALAAEGISHEYEEFEGTHEWKYWENHLADTLRFFARHV